jgi:gamma-glutamyltranspeptidase
MNKQQNFNSLPNLFLLPGYHLTEKDYEENTALTFHRIIEAFQMGYAQRYKLADPDYEKSVNEVS